MNYGKKGSKKRQAELTSKGIMYGKKMCHNKEKSENIDSVAYCILYLFHDSILIQKTAKYTLL